MAGNSAESIFIYIWDQFQLGQNFGILPFSWIAYRALPGYDLNSMRREIEETPGRSSESPQEGQAEQQTIEEILSPTEPRGPVDALEKSFGSLSVEQEERDRSRLPGIAYRRRKPRGGASRKK